MPSFLFYFAALWQIANTFVKGIQCLFPCFEESNAHGLQDV